MRPYGTACPGIITSVERMIRNYVRSDGSGRLRPGDAFFFFLRSLTREKLSCETLLTRGGERSFLNASERHGINSLCLSGYFRGPLNNRLLFFFICLLVSICPILSFTRQRLDRFFLKPGRSPLVEFKGVYKI